MSIRIGTLADLHGSLDPSERGSWFNAYDFARTLPRIEEAFGWFAEEEVDVVVLAGDLTHRADNDALEGLLAHMVRLTSCPLVAVSGNHDVAPAGRTPLPDAVASTGSPLLRLARPEGELHGDIRLAGVHVATAEDWFRARLAAPPDVGAWGEEPVVLVSHFPLLSHAVALADRGLAHPGDVLDRAAVAERLLTRGAPTVVLSGHVHARAVALAGPVLQLTQAALIEPPFDAAVVELGLERDVLRARRRTRRVDDAPARWEPVLAKGSGAWRFAAGHWVADAAREEGRTVPQAV
jgi:3',5'-cyclic AMP phosphodiesterase CpdA